MMIKLAIIGAVLLLGGVLFSSELAEMFPESLGLLSSVEDNLDGIRNSTMQSFDGKISGGITDVNAKFSQIRDSSADYVNDNIRENLPEIKAPELFAGAEP